MILPPRERATVGETFARVQEHSPPAENQDFPVNDIPGQNAAYGLPDDFDDTQFRNDTGFPPRAYDDDLGSSEIYKETLKEKLETSFIETDFRLSQSTSLVDELLSLFYAFQSSSSIIRSMPSSTCDLDSTQEEIKESKSQLILSQEEARIWHEVRALLAHPHKAQTTLALADLTQRSEFLSDAYEKRSKPPPPEAYTESRVLIEAMGIPCLESSGPYEAEGLAASLVRHGRAHVVASEDTVRFSSITCSRFTLISFEDVLVYGAPLLRNITSRAEPLSLVAPSEVRQALNFSRAAFLDFCLLLGTDFTMRLRSLGPVRALAMIHQYSRIERILVKESRYRPKDLKSYLEEVCRARMVFTRLPPIPRKDRLEMKQVDKERVTELLSRFELAGVANARDWRSDALLAGNYFGEYSTSGEGFPNSYTYT